MSKHIWFDSASKKPNVVLRYGDEEITFLMTYYHKGYDSSDMESAPSPFAEFNNYVKTKPPIWHKEMFERYKQIKEDIQTINNVENLLKVLNKRFIELYKEVDLEEIKAWVRLPTSGIYIANKSNETYDVETTYNYHDYLELVTYALALRFIAPIWGDINNRMNAEYGKDIREVYSMEILHGTCMASDPSRGIICKAEERLKEFIIKSKMALDTNAVLLSGLSEDDFYEYLYCAIVMKRISQGDISGNSERFNLIARTYYFLGNKVKQASKSYGRESVQIQMKKNPVVDRKGDDANSQSVLDVGFVRSRILTNEKVFLKYAVKDHQRLIQTLCPDLPEKLYWESMDTIKQMNTNHSFHASTREYMLPIQEVQLTLTKWVVHSSVNTVIFDHLELDEIIELIGLVRAILWHKGFHIFAAIISAVALPASEDSTFIAPPSRSNLDQQLVERLNKAYDLGGTTKSEKSNMSYIGCLDNAINKQLSKFNWLLTLPDSWLENSKVIHKDKRLIIPSDIRNRIAELMLMIEENQYVQERTPFDD